jgi:hypothetical protein
MRLRLSDAASSSVLAEHYRAQAEMCHQMARMTVSPFKEGWLEFADEWTPAADGRSHADEIVRRIKLRSAGRLAPEKEYDFASTNRHRSR